MSATDFGKVPVKLLHAIARISAAFGRLGNGWATYVGLALLRFELPAMSARAVPG
jgi:hypothetical protein